MKRNMVKSSSMNIRRLYIVNDGADDMDMLFMSCLLHPFDYKLVGARCGGREVNVVMGYHEECIDELEFEVIGKKRELDDVMYDLYGVDAKGGVAMADMIFVAETDNGEFIEFDIGMVRVMWQEFAEVEEELEEEEDEEEVDGNALLRVWQDYAKALKELEPGSESGEGA